MTPENFPAPLFQSERPKAPDAHQNDKLNKNRLLAMFTILAMLLISAFFGYRLQIGPFGLTFERIENGDILKPPMHKP